MSCTYPGLHLTVLRPRSSIAIVSPVPAVMAQLEEAMVLQTTLEIFQFPKCILSREGPELLGVVCSNDVESQSGRYRRASRVGDPIAGCTQTSTNGSGYSTNCKTSLFYVVKQSRTDDECRRLCKVWCLLGQDFDLLPIASSSLRSMHVGLDPRLHFMDVSEDRLDEFTTSLRCIDAITVRRAHIHRFERMVRTLR